MNIKYRYLKDGLDLVSLAGQGLGRQSLFYPEGKIQKWDFYNVYWSLGVI